MNEKSDKPIYNISDEALHAYFFKYFKIIGIYFILPFWLVLAINEIPVIVKIFSWLQNDIYFWYVERYLFVSLLLGIAIPFFYAIWFFYKTIQKVSLAFHKDVLVEWNKELADKITDILLQSYAKGNHNPKTLNFDEILLWISHKLSRLPKWIQWICRKLLNQIPFVELVNSYDFKDLEEKNKPAISENIEAKINAFQFEIIESLVPWQFMFLIPFNILLLYTYYKF